MSEKPKQFPQEVFRIFDRYIHGFIDRREFLESVRRFAAAGMTATAILEAFMPNFALGQQIAKDDSRIAGEYATLPSPNGHGTIAGILPGPAKAQLFLQAAASTVSVNLK
jgi:carboxymethylenebutenolidase